MTKSSLPRFAKWLTSGIALIGIASSLQAQSLLRDAETEHLLKDVTRPIFEAAKVTSESVDLYLVNDPTINAGVGGGQNIFMNTGLLLQADNLSQIIGVYAHETGHIAGGHLSRQGDGAKGATGISLLSLLLGAAAVAAGAGDAGIAILQGGQALAAGSFLAYSKGEESSADQAGASYLEKLNMSGKGLIEFFGKLQSQEYRLGVKQESYFRSHPLSSDRITRLEERVTSSKSYNTETDPKLEYRFQRIKAKLAGFLGEPQRTFQLYPESNTSEYARYARAYAWHKLADVPKARAEMEALLKIKPNDPYYLELLGQVLLESGEVKESVAPLRAAVAAAPNEPLIQSLLGHALISTEDPKDFVEARAILEKSVRLDAENPFAWYQLGIVYSRQGDEPRAALASAERLSRIGEFPQAGANARLAVKGLKSGTPEWIRAQDIVLLTDNEAKKKKSRRG
jgi:predicted Zn-dependent protease